ncbi:hypothetical protein [Streptomyces turgidiscabies]|uniref:hypothetical protein n=1 Tax=Streptomyces turgidiscabies TaxID=85558 RepID=UPI0038F7BDC5
MVIEQRLLQGGEAALAQLVGTVLASAHDADFRDAAEVRTITDAMVRLLIGAPLHSDGKLTVVLLVAEAGLRRNKLTRKHTGLKDLFYALVKAHVPLPETESGTARLSSSRTWPESAPNGTTCAPRPSSWPGSANFWR